ncbi:MAG TPA: hydrogenase expression/formation protein HypE [Actinocrinis sp.]|nr:hydrogenase expression/formation protein HypE [Actinocrinis sp.]
MSVINDPIQATCPVPHTEHERVLLGHGSGGQLSARLLHDVIVPALGAAAADLSLDDAAVLDPELFAVAGEATPGSAVVTTDSFVVDPLRFPGGDIGTLAVHGTINDLAMRGAQPLALTVALIVEEGFPLAELRDLVESAGLAAAAAGVPIVAGDTKVVGRGCADKLFINTTGFGRRAPQVRCSATAIQAGDAILLSGPIGLHGVTVLATREDLGFDADPQLRSDTKPLHRLAQAMLDAGGADVHALRDPTRGGLASALNELADASGVGMLVEESAIPVPPVVAAACDLLGLDPLHVANEGCAVAFVHPAGADAVLAAMRACPEGAQAVRIGTVVADNPGRVALHTLVGAYRIVDMLVGEQLPRIC